MLFLSGANGPSKSARALAGANCDRPAVFWSPRLRRKRDRFPGANFGRGAALWLGLARACQGFRWPALAWAAAGRRTARALTGRPWPRGRGLGFVRSLLGCRDLGCEFVGIAGLYSRPAGSAAAIHVGPGRLPTPPAPPC